MRRVPALPLLVLLLLLLPRPSAAEELPEAARKALDLSPYAGKVVYLDFWASWCAPCKASYPWMLDLQRRLGDEGLVVLTVNVDRDEKAARRFLDGFDETLPVIYDPKGEIAQAFQLQAMPTSFVFGRDGELRQVHLGFHPDKKEEVEAEVEELLAEKGDQDAPED